MKGTKSVVGLAIVALSTLAASAAVAQDTTALPLTTPVSIPEQLNAAFFANDRDFYQNRSIPRQISYIFGPGILIRNSFTDNEIARDGKAVNQVLREILVRQGSGPILRTADLPNPFNTSVRTLPVVDQPAGVVIAPPVELTPNVPLPPQNTQQQVPALW